MSTQTRLSLEEFLAMPGIDERRLELIDGEVYEKLSPRWGHGYIAGELYAILRNFGFASVEPRAVIAAAGNLDASAPIADLAFYLQRPPAALDWMTRPPDIVLEVLSPGQHRREMRAKVDAYIAFGVPTVWLIDPESRSADIYELGARRTISDNEPLTSRTLPDLAIDLRDIFDRAGL